MARAEPQGATRPPIPPAMLERLVLRWRRQAVSSGAGAHLRRRQGHSLEFREFRAWQRGDDVRSVDWRASARLPRKGDLLARSFEAEERMTLAVLLDNRPEMGLPDGMPKLLYALWAVGALAALALDRGDRVIVGRLFDGAAEASVTADSVHGAARLRTWTEAQWHGRAALRMPDNAGFADLDALLRRLEPAAAVVVVSDMLFHDPAGAFTRFAIRAQERRRSLSILQLDSVQHETALLRAARDFRLVRHGGDGELGTFDEAAFRDGAGAIAAHLAALRHRIGKGGLDWPPEPVSWPVSWPMPSAGTEALKALFVGTFPRLPLLSGLSAGGRA